MQCHSNGSRQSLATLLALAALPAAQKRQLEAMKWLSTARLLMRFF
ncbi:hypothetical protein P0F29_003208 [Vibrio metschnikovii]|nr:hypothetical protein [Vibrio metschnikovii]